MNGRIIFRLIINQYPKALFCSSKSSKKLYKILFVLKRRYLAAFFFRHTLDIFSQSWIRSSRSFGPVPPLMVIMINTIICVIRLYDYTNVIRLNTILLLETCIKKIMLIRVVMSTIEATLNIRFVESSNLVCHGVPLSCVVNWTLYVIELTISSLKTKHRNVFVKLRIVFIDMEVMPHNH